VVPARVPGARPNEGDPQMEDQAARERRLRRERARPPRNIIGGGPGGDVAPSGADAGRLCWPSPSAWQLTSRVRSVVFAFKARSEAVRRFWLAPIRACGLGRPRGWGARGRP
jgi:hypothetical protein